MHRLKTSNLKSNFSLFKLNTNFFKNTNVNLLNKIQNQNVHSKTKFDHNRECDGQPIGEVVLTTKYGVEILLDPLINKGTGFPMEERERLAIRGLVPPRLPTNEILEEQTKRLMKTFYEISSPLNKYIFLNNLQDRNSVLFYKCLVDNLEELAPIIYTPTVVEACKSYSTILRRPRGMFFSAKDKGMMRSMVYNWPTDDVELIVVTDGSRILGIGDQGTNGMPVPIGKLALYTACGGIHPSKCLPIVIDVGTNNQELLDDPMYLGLQQKRLRGQEYDEIIEEFINAIRERFPNVLLQFEDFSIENASRILEKYRNKILCFNPDIQGTGTVALAGILSALRMIGYVDARKALCDQRIIIVGAGSAGLGVGQSVLFHMVEAGLSIKEARKRFWLVDKDGSLGNGRKVEFTNQESWVRTEVKDKLTLEQLVKEVKPTIILGLTGIGGVYTEKTIREMSTHCERPIIFPLSNPAKNAECSAEQAYRWSEGRCIYGSGSFFPPVSYGNDLLFPAQHNNFYSYPGIALGALVSKSKTITDKMLNSAANALAEAVSEEDLKSGVIFPKTKDIPRVSKKIAFAVAKQSFADGVARIPRFESDNELDEAINDRFWEPKYGSIIRVEESII